MHPVVSQEIHLDIFRDRLLIDRSINGLIDRFINGLIGMLIDKPICELIDGRIDRLVNGKTSSDIKHSLSVTFTFKIQITTYAIQILPKLGRLTIF